MFRVWIDETDNDPNRQRMVYSMLTVQFDLYEGPDCFKVNLIADYRGIAFTIINESTGGIVQIYPSGLSDMLIAANYLPDLTYRNCYHCGYGQIPFSRKWCSLCRKFSPADSVE